MFRIGRGRVPEHVRQWFEPLFAGCRGTGAAFWPPRQVYVLQFGRGDAVPDTRAQLVSQRSGFGDSLQYSLLAFLHLVEHIGPVPHFGDLCVVHAACLFLAVAADERNGVAVGEHLYAILNLPVLDSEQTGYVLDIDFFHFAGLILRNFSPSTPQKASPKMPPDILEVPSWRFTKITGTSASLNPSFLAVYFISIWNP